MLTIYGTHFCPNTLYAIMKCKEAGITPAFKNIAGSLEVMKEFIALRDKTPLFDSWKSRRQDRHTILCARRWYADL